MSHIGNSNPKKHHNAEDFGIIYANEYLNGLNAETLEAKCQSVLDKGKKKIIINFKKTELINSIGVSIIISIIEKIKDAEAELFFCSLNDVHADTFEMLGLSKYAYTFSSEKEAVLDFKKSKRNSLGGGISG